MADIKVVIQLQDTIEDEINSLESPTYINNASIQKTGEQFNALSTKSAGANLKSWATGSLSLADGYVGGANTQLIEQYGYNGYVFGAVPESKQLTVTLEVVGKHIDSIIVYGDRTANQFPTKAYRDGNPNDIIYSDDPVWAIKFDQQSTSHTITFLEWNRANYNACITYVAELKNELTLDKSWIKSLETLSQSTGQPKDIYYGVTPSSGTLEILDVNGEMKDYLVDNIISSNNVNLKIWANNSLIQEQVSNDVDYDLSSSVMSLTLKSENNLDEVITISLKDYGNSNYISLKEILETYVFKTNIDNMLQEKTIITDYENNIDEEVSIDNYLQRIKVKIIYIFKKSRYEILNYICNIAQISFVQKSNNHFCFVSLRPKVIAKNVIKINKNQMFGNFIYDIIKNNKYQKVKINYKKIDITEENVYERQITLKDNPTPTSPYSASAIGLNSTISEQIDINAAFAKFFDTLKQSENIYYSLEGSPKWSVVKAISTYSNNANVLDAGSLSFSSQSVSDFNSSADISNAFGGEIILLDSNANKDINPDYTFSVCIDISPNNSGTASNPVLTNYDSANISILAHKYSFSDSSVTYGDGEKTFEVVENPLMTDFTILNIGNKEYKMSHILATNILNDYSDGLKTAKCTIGCMDYYDTQANLIKNWSIGNILDVGDLVSCDGNKGIWRVTGRTFRKEGVPMIDLELQEVKTDKYYIEQTSYEPNQMYEMSSGDGNISVLWYKTFEFDKENGVAILSDAAVKSDYYNGAVLYWADETTKNYTKIKLTSNLSGLELSCTAEAYEYSIKENMQY